MVRLVLFDIDGTLIRTGGAGVKAFGKVFATEFGATDGFQRLKFAGRTDRAIVREFFLFHGIPTTPQNFQRFFDRYVFWLAEFLNQARVEICEGAAEFIDQLRKVPVPPLLGLLTGNIRLGAEIKLRKAGLWEEFSVGGFGDDDEDRARIAAIARERGGGQLGREPAGGEVLVIGDTPLDIACARAIEAKVLAVASGGATLEELKAHHPDWAVANLFELTARQAVEGDLRLRRSHSLRPN